MSVAEDDRYPGKVQQRFQLGSWTMETYGVATCLKSL